MKGISIVQSVPRYHFLDSSRAIFMLLGIPYHASLVFIPTEHWTVTYGDGNYALLFIGGWAHSFRMPAFFMIAGFFSALLLERRSPGAWIRSRAIRLGVPLLAAAILLNPIQMATELEAHGALSWRSLGEVLGHPGGHWIRHLWFLQVLIIYSICVAVLWKPLIVRYRDLVNSGINKIWERRNPIFVVIAICVGWNVALAGVTFALKLDMKAIYGLLDGHLVMRNAPYFLIGVVVGIRRDFIDREYEVDWKIIAVAVSSVIVFIVTWQDERFYPRVIYTFVDPISAITMSYIAFSIIKRRMNKSSELASRIVDYSFPIYLFHQPLIGLFALIIAPLGMPDYLMYFAIILSVFVVSYALSALAMQWSVSRFLFCGIPWVRERSAPR